VFARVSTFKGGMERLDEGIALFRDRVVPEDEKQPGFEGALLLVDREARVSRAVTFWHSEEELNATSELGKRLAETAAHELELEVEVSTCEVPFARLPALVA
jgi:heme-degrading monooxygenase HmoA